MNAPATQGNGNNVVVQGRIVWTSGSSLFEGKKKTDFNTGAPILADDGSPLLEYGFGLAIPKYNPQTGQPTPEFTKIWQMLHAEAFTLYPSGQLPPDFAMKYKDGDAIDHNGKPFADREGYKGHLILNCTTQIAIKFFIFQGGNNILVNTGIKCGDYVNVQLNVKAHPAKGRGKPGLYLNPSAVQLIQPGAEIINTPSGDQMFGQQAPAYAGQVIAPTNAVMPGMAAPMGPPPMQQQFGAQVPQQAYNPQQANQYQGMPAQAPMQADPHYGVLPPNFQPPQQASQMPAQAPMQQQQAPNNFPAMPGMPGQR